MPNTSTPSISSEVAIGRRMKGSEMLIGAPRPQLAEPAGFRRQQPDPRAVGQPVLALDHDPLTGRQVPC